MEYTKKGTFSVLLHIMASDAKDSLREHENGKSEIKQPLSFTRTEKKPDIPAPQERTITIHGVTLPADAELHTIVEKLGFIWNRETIGKKLAALAGVDPEKYTGKPDENMKIRNKLVRNEIDINAVLKEDNINQFTPIQQGFIKEAISQGILKKNISTYIDVMDKPQLKKLAALKSERELIDFLRSQNKKQASWYGDEKKEAETYVQYMGDIALATTFDAELSIFERKFNIDELAEIRKQATQDVAATPKASEKYKDFYRARVLSKIHHEKYAQLSAEEKERFKILRQQYYEYSQRKNINLADIWGNDMIQEVKAEVYEKYVLQQTKNPVFDRVKDSLVNNENVSKEFSNALPKETFDDPAIKDDLIKYNKNIPQEYQQYFDVKGNIITEKYTQAKEIEKRMINKFQAQRLAIAKEYVHDETNTTIKKQTINLMIESVKSLFNVTVENAGEIESWISAFQADLQKENTPGENVKITFKGNIKGKAITLIYDIQEGTLASNEYLIQQGEKEQSTFVVNSDTLKAKKLDLIHMPTLQDGITAAKRLPLAQMLSTSQGDISAYTKEIEKNMYNEMLPLLPQEDEKAYVEKQMMRNIVIQEMMSLMGVDKTGAWEIDMKDQNIHKLYQYVYESMNFYTLDEMLKFRTLVKTYSTIESLQKMSTEKTENKEQIVIRQLLQEKQKRTPEYRGQPFGALRDLLKDDQQWTYQNHIIDFQKFSLFLERAQKENPEHTKVPTAYEDKIEAMIGPEQANQDLTQQLENIQFA